MGSAARDKLTNDIPTIQRLETATIHSWPAISSAMDGMWLARFARGYTRRSNSIQCLDPADDADAPARLARMIDLYLLNSRDPVFRVTPLAGPRVVAALDADGWVPEDDCRVLAMPLLGDSPPGEAHLYETTDANFIEAISGLMGIDRRSREIMTVLFGLIAYRNAGLLIRDAAGDPAAGALAVNAAGIGTFHCVIVRKEARGKGLGRAIMAAALGWAREAGATHAALQVVAANTPAVNLYTSLGFSEAYRYHYRRPA
jgi:N-acetylglutamate synthase